MSLSTQEAPLGLAPAAISNIRLGFKGFIAKNVYIAR
jgi:hypothetical protein